METVTILKKEYEKLRMNSLKIKLIEETIHGELSTHTLMGLQENQESLTFLKEKEEDIYTTVDLKEVWKKER